MEASCGSMEAWLCFGQGLARHAGPSGNVSRVGGSRSARCSCTCMHVTFPSPSPPEPEESDIEIKVLEYWKAKEYQWPALAKMVKQYFAAGFVCRRRARLLGSRQDAWRPPKISQGLDLDSTLEHSLFAAFNTD